MKTQIETREHIEKLIHLFYAQVRQDEIIGRIFNDAISDWDNHLIHLTDFWETNLLFVQKFKGNPPKTHTDLDKKENHTINQGHFDRWIELWNKTIDENFEGRLADEAKSRAKNIAAVLLRKIISVRP